MVYMCSIYVSWNTYLEDCLLRTYQNRDIEKICTNADFAKKKLSPKMYSKICKRISEIQSANSIQALINIGRCHKLTGKREDQYAIDLVHPYRLIFKFFNDKEPTAQICEIVNYH